MRGKQVTVINTDGSKAIEETSRDIFSAANISPLSAFGVPDVLIETKGALGSAAALVTATSAAIIASE
jgi:hypothetical protein